MAGWTSYWLRAFFCSCASAFRTIFKVVKFNFFFTAKNCLFKINFYIKSKVVTFYRGVWIRSAPKSETAHSTKERAEYII